jgi:hypothetical protein
VLVETSDACPGFPNSRFGNGSQLHFIASLLRHRKSSFKLDRHLQFLKPEGDLLDGLNLHGLGDWLWQFVLTHRMKGGVVKSLPPFPIEDARSAIQG